MDVRLPNGRLIQGVPDGVTKEEIARKAIAGGLATPQDFPGLSFDEPTLLGRAAEFAKGIPRGFLSSYASAAQGVGELGDLVGADEDNALIEFGQRSREAVEDSFAAAPGYGDLWTTKFGDALGSLASFFTPGVALKALGYAGKAGRVAAGAGLGATMTAGVGAERVEAQRELGVDVPEEVQDRAVLLNALIGLSEVAPVEKILRGIPKEALNQPFLKSLMPRLKSALGSGSVEAVQEVASGLAQDAVEKNLYNPDLPIGQSAWDDMTLGGAAGATADLLLNAFAGRRIIGLTAEQRELERSRRLNEDAALKRRAQEFPDLPPEEAAGLLPFIPEPTPQAQTREEALNLAGQQDIPYGTTFSSLETLDDGTTRPGLVVLDDKGNPFGPEFKTPEEAAIFAGALNETVLNREVDGAIDLAIDQSPEAYDSGAKLRLRALGRRLFHPQENTFTREQVNTAAGTTIDYGYANASLTAQEALDAGLKPREMTAAQRINAARLKRGLRESNQFNAAEARAVLGDRFGNLSEFQHVPIGANETFEAAKVGDQYVVRSNLGEVIKTRKATVKEQLANPDSRRVGFTKKKEAENYAAYLNSKRNDLITRGDLFDESEITAEEISNMLRAKNIIDGIDSPAVRSIAAAVTGHSARGKTTIADMSNGERAMLYQKIRSLPEFRRPTRLPTFGLRPYSNTQYQQAKKVALKRAENFALGDVGVPSKAEIEAAGQPLSDTAYQRLIKDLAADQALRRDIEVAQNRQRQLNARTQRQEAQNAPAIEEQRKARQREEQGVYRAVRQAMKGYGLDRVGTTMVDYLRQAKRGLNGDVVLGKRLPAEAEGAYDKRLNEIFLALEQLKTDPRYLASPTQETLEQIALETLSHEMIHAMRQADLFTDQEWQALERAARSHRKRYKIGNQNFETSYTEWAARFYPDFSPVNQMEEAIAEMVRDALSGQLVIGGRPRSLLRRIAEFLRGIIGLKEKHGYRRFEDIVAAVRSGEIGARPEGEIRTMREIERAREQIPERGIVARQPVQAPEPGEAAAAPASTGQSSPDWVERRVYHGSPHTFSEFKMAHIGSGAGVQAQGYGLYFTTRRDFAEAYSKLNELIEPPGQAGEGALYEVEIDDAVIGRMLRMDLPLYKQDWIMGQLRAAANRGDTIANDMLARIAAAEDSYGRDSVKGSDLIEGMGRSVISMNTRISPRAVPKALSEYLLSLDIPGSVYGVAKDSTKGGLIGPLLEQLKPGAKVQMNLVAFNEQDIRVISRNDQPIEQIVKEQIPGVEQLQKDAGLTDNMFSRRLARAQEQGFDVSTVWYHGTDVPNIRRFEGRRGSAGHFSRDPGFASRFAATFADDPNATPDATVYPVFLRVKSSFDPRNGEQVDALERYLDTPEAMQVAIDKVNRLANRNGRKLDDQRLREIGAMEIDMGRKVLENIRADNFDWADLERLTGVLRAAGYDSYYDYEFAGEPSTGLAVFDADNIKGVFAEFNPEAVPQGQEYTDDIMYSRRGVAMYKPERIQNLWGEHGYADGRAVAAVAYIDPLDFVEVTTASELGYQRLREEAGPLDRERLSRETQTPFLQIEREGNDYRVVGHEGRHRMAAMASAGVRMAPVVLRTKWTSYDDTSTSMPAEGALRGQTFYEHDPSRAIVSYSNLLDITRDNWPKIKQNFGGEGGASDVVFSRRRVGATGKYVGAPPGVNSPQKLGALLIKVKNLAEEGEPGRFWYERSGQAVLDFVGGDINEAEKLLKAIAVTSVGTRVDLNFRFALQAYLQHKAGHKVRTGRRPADMSKKLQDIFDGKPWTGVSQKTKNFYNNLMAEIDPSRVLWEKGDATEHGVTTDIWMMRAFGYYRDSPTAAQYKFVADEVTRLAKQLDWTPHQVQAAIWVAMKARAERPDVKKRANEISIRKGWAERRRNKEGKMALVVTNPEKHSQNWTRQAMQTDPTTEDTAQANFGYDDAIENTLAQISWESAPGRTTNHLQELLDAPMEVRKAFHVAISKAFLDEQGRDLVAKALGLPSPGDFEAPGYWDGATSPSTQTQVAAPHQYKGADYGEIEQAAEALISAYAAVRGILLRQDAIGWHRPFFDPRIALDNVNAVEVNIGRPFTEEEIVQLGELVASRARQDMFNPVEPPALVSGPAGVRVLNVDEQAVSNEQFRAMVESSLTGLQLDNNDTFTAKWFRSQGALLEHDWKGGSNGEGYLRVGRLSGRPDLQRKVRDLVSQIEPRVRAVEQEFADRYGWTLGSDLVYSRRLAEPAVRSATGGQESLQEEVRGIILGPRKVPGASAYSAVHYGNTPTELLEGERYGSGIRGAERQRVERSSDPRVKRRVYFYIETDTSTRDPYMAEKIAQSHKRPEPGLGPYVHVQRFENILNLESAEAHRFIKEEDDATESAIIDAGYDGYAVPSRSAMVILNHDVPVQSLGHAFDLEKAGFPVRMNRETALNPEVVAEIVAQNKAAAAQPFHAPPAYSYRASPEAQYIARHPEQGLKPSDDMKFSLITPQHGPAISAVAANAPSERGPFQYYELATGALETPSRLSYALSWMKQKAINRYARLEKLNWSTHLRENLADTSSIAAALMTDRSLGIVAAAIRHGRPVYINGTTMVVNKNTIPELQKHNPQAAQRLLTELQRQGINPDEAQSLIEVMAPLYSKQYGNLTRAAQAYAMAQRSPRLRREGKETPTTPRQEAEIAAEIQQYVDENGRNIIEDWWANWKTYNEGTITFLQNTGVLNAETAQLWRDMADYYPFYRVAEGGGKQFRQGQKVFGGMTAAVSMRKLKGGESPVNMPLEEAISLNLSAAIQMGMKNVAQQRIVRDMRELGLAEEIRPGQPSLAPVVEFRVAGQQRRFAIFDPLIYESMLPLEGTEVVSFVKHTFGKPATALRELVTRDPGFMAVNLLRDSMSAFVTSGAKMTPLLGTFKGLFDGVERLEKLGVVGGYDYANDPDNITKFWTNALREHNSEGPGSINIFMRMWDALGRGTTASDGATRNAVFDDVFARTGNVAEAAFQAMEVINFSRRGRSPLIRMISAMVPFLNARFQGVDVLFRSYTGQYTANRDRNKAQVIASALARGSLLTAGTLLYYLMVSDDDQYEQASDWQRDNNWIIPTPWGVPITIPIPFEVGLIFKTIPETIAAHHLGKKSGKEMRDTFVRGVGSTMEISPFQIQFMGPLLEAAINYNSFTGRQIVPQYLMDGGEAGLQSRPYNTEFAKFIGEALNISPMKIDHAVTGYIGTMGQYVYDWIDVGLKSQFIQGDNKSVMPRRMWWDYPIIKRLVGQRTGSGLMEDAYDLWRDVNKVYSTMNSLRDDGDMDRLQAYIMGREHMLALRGPVNSVKKLLDKLRKQKERITQSDMPSDAKQREIEKLEIQVNAILGDAIPMLKEQAQQPFWEPTFHDE